MHIPARRSRWSPSALRMSPLAWREARWGYIFILPWIVGFFIFTLAPMIASLAFTFTNINLAQEEPLRFVGLDNYQTLIADPLFRVFRVPEDQMQMPALADRIARARKASTN